VGYRDHDYMLSIGGYVYKYYTGVASEHVVNQLLDHNSDGTAQLLPNDADTLLMDNADGEEPFGDGNDSVPTTDLVDTQVDGVGDVSHQEDKVVGTIEPLFEAAAEIQKQTLLQLNISGASDSLNPAILASAASVVANVENDIKTQGEHLTKHETVSLSNESSNSGNIHYDRPLLEPVQPVIDKTRLHVSRTHDAPFVALESVDEAARKQQETHATPSQICTNKQSACCAFRNCN
jgi:hypothetical protein